eukprot:gene7257-8065_t
MTSLNPELRKQILEDMLGTSYEAYVNFKKEPMLPKKRQHRKRIPLWRFLLHLLHRDRLASLIEWTVIDRFEFRIKEPTEVAYLWGSIKDKSDMTYEKLGRAMRYYYGKNIIEKVPGMRYSYRFIPSKKTKKYIESFARKFPVYSSEDTEGSESSLDSLKDDNERVDSMLDDPCLTYSPSSYLNGEYDSPKSSDTSSETVEDSDLLKQEDLSAIYSNTFLAGCDTFETEISMLEYPAAENDGALKRPLVGGPMWMIPAAPSVDGGVKLTKSDKCAHDGFFFDLTTASDHEMYATKIQSIAEM